MPASPSHAFPEKQSEIHHQRMAAGRNVYLAVILAAACFCVANYCASRLYAKWHFDAGVAGGLSTRTQSVLQTSQGEMTLTSMFEQSHPYARSARKLLQAYAESSALIQGLVIHTRSLNVNQDVMETAEVMRRHPAEPNSILIECGPEYRIIRESDMIAHTPVDPDHPDADQHEMFIGESACTSAIIDLLKPTDSTLYFVVGHGEYDPDSYHHITGASAIAQELNRMGITLRKINLSQSPVVPPDCNGLIIAGPQTLFSPSESDALATYLKRGGKAMLLLDDPFAAGLAPLVEQWGIHVGNTPGPQQLPVRISTTDFADHPTTRHLQNVMTAFSNPCALEILHVGPVEGRRDKPVVYPIILAPASTFNQSSSAFQSASPVQPIVAAAELGLSLQGRETAKLIVCGDSDFISNAMTQRGFQGNVRFFLSAVEWLLGNRFQPYSESVANVALDPGISPVGGWRELAFKLVIALPLALLVLWSLLIAPLFRKL